MADTSGVQPYNFPASQVSDFERLGHPGKFHKSITCVSGTTTYFTGSNYGAGALIIPNGSTGTASLSLGGDISLGALASSAPYIWELSLNSVKVDGGTVYVLIRNQVIR
jgi:hypothetical protein